MYDKIVNRQVARLISEINKIQQDNKQINTLILRYMWYLAKDIDALKSVNSSEIPNS
jgi:hypothetical protein